MEKLCETEREDGTGDAPAMQRNGDFAGEKRGLRERRRFFSSEVKDFDLGEFCFEK